MKAIAAVLLTAVLTAQQATVVTRGDSSRRLVALTFDAGADRGYAATILSTLERAHAHAAFGMTGAWASANSDLVRRIARDGDTFINHTYDHRSFTGLSTQTAPLTWSQRAWEIRRTEQIVYGLTKRSTKPFFRPPYGDYDAQTVSEAAALGYRYVVMWTVDSLGWYGLSAPAILRRCLTLVGPGSIILMHVGSRSQDALALPALISGLRRDGFRLVTVRQLLTGR
jgi:peptidoglycan/xylan/chitin deacetylase (PgdA/CDA1 family)